MKNLPPWTSICLLIVVSALCRAQETTSKRPELVVQTGHSDTVYSVAFSPDGKILASASNDKTIKLWDVSTGTELRTIRGDGAVAFSPDGKTLAIGATLWNVSTGTKLRTITNRYGEAVFSPNWQMLAIDDTLWDVTAGAEMRTRKDPSHIVTNAFSPDGKILAGGSWEGAIKLWDLATDTELRTIGIVSDGHVHSVAFSPDGKVLATVTSSGPILESGSSLHDVKLWDVASGRLLRTIESVSVSISVAFSPEGKIFASRSASGKENDSVRIWDIATGTLLRTLPGRCCVPPGKGANNLVVFSPDGKTLATSDSNGAIKLWEISSGSELRTLNGHSAFVESVALSPDGKLLAVGSKDSNVRLWDVSSDAEARTLRGHTRSVQSVAFSPDGKTLASGSLDGTVKLWNISNPTELQTLKAHDVLPDSIYAIAFSGDGKTLASATEYNDAIKLWDLSNGAERKTLKTIGTALAFNPDRKSLAFGDAGTIVLADITTGAERTIEVHSRGIVWSLAFSPDGKTLASSSAGKGDVDRTVKLWDVSSGNLLRTLHGPTIESLAFSSDGKMLAGGGSDGALKLWSPSTGNELQTFGGHQDPVNSIAFSANNQYLISGSQDSTVKIWNVSSGRELATLVAIDQSDWLVVTPDGLFDGSPGAWTRIVWRFNNNTFDFRPLEAFFNEFYHPGLLTEIFTGEHAVAPSNIAQKDLRQPQLRLELADTRSAANARQVRLKIDVSDAPAGAQDLRLFRNGSLVRVWHGDVLKGQTSATLETTSPLVAGENRLTAYAFNHDNVKSSNATLVINGADSLKRRGVAFVVAVGINEYANSEYNLRNAVADAQDFAEEFKRQQAKLNHYARVEVVPLLDRNATKAKILKSLSDISAKVQPDDALMIYFAGHGTAQADRFYLIPHDLGYKGSRESFDRDGLTLVVAHSISDQELERAVENIDAEQMVLVIDACNSGQALEAEEKRRGPMNSKGLAQLAYEKGMYVLTAAQSYQAALEADRLGHGYLTFALVEEGLKTNAADRAPKDGQVLLREWLDYATQRVPQMQQDTIDDQSRQGLPAERIIKFAEGDAGSTRNVQRPRVFYRRETEAVPLVVAKPAAPQPQRATKQ